MFTNSPFVSFEQLWIKCMISKDIHIKSQISNSIYHKKENFPAVKSHAGKNYWCICRTVQDVRAILSLSGLSRGRVDGPFSRWMAQNCIGFWLRSCMTKKFAGCLPLCHITPQIPRSFPFSKTKNKNTNIKLFTSCALIHQFI